MGAGPGVVLASFAGEQDADGEAVRLSVALDDDLRAWRTLPGLVRSGVGTRGIRDPFLLHDAAAGRFVLLGTDLRTWPDHDWTSAVTHGSRSIVVSESGDLLSWAPPRLVEVAPPDAGNAWAPKALRSADGWLVFFASARYPAGPRSAEGSHQRILVTATKDFRTFSPARTYLDPGHDVIDLAFAQLDGGLLRFSVRHPDRLLPTFVTVERGAAVEGEFVTVVQDLGRGRLGQAEGPAPLAIGPAVVVLLDEFGGSGYHLFRTDDARGDDWRQVDGARLPARARHGSLLPVPAAVRAGLLREGAEVAIR